MSALSIVIVRPEGYPHSEVFREMALTLHHGLLDLGHKSEITHDLNPKGRSIVLGANLLSAVKGQIAPDAIVYNLEQIDPASRWLTPSMLQVLATHEVWDYSPRNASLYSTLGLRTPRVVPVAYHPCLTRIEPAKEDIDVLFYGCLNGRRSALLGRIAHEGLRVGYVPPGIYGAERDRHIARARVVLNAHFYDAAIFEMTRISYALANRKCVVSEWGKDEAMEAPFVDGVEFGEYDELPGLCRELVANAERRKRIAERGFEAMRAVRVEDVLREALARPQP